MVLISLKARLTCSSSVQLSHRVQQLRRDRKATAKISGCLLFLSALILNAWCFQEATLVGSNLQGELLRGLLRSVVFHSECIFLLKFPNTPLPPKARQNRFVGLLPDGCCLCAAVSCFGYQRGSQCAGPLCSTGRQNVGSTTVQCHS